MADCFAKCGFGTPSEGQTQEPALEFDDWRKLAVTSWTGQDFVSADDDLVTCGLHTMEDTAKELFTQPDTTSDEDDDCGSSHG